MTRGRLLALNALSMLIANIVSKLVLFIGLVFLFQFLSPELESVYYLVTAICLIVTMNFQDGMIAVTIRKIATDHENGPFVLGTCFFASGLLAMGLFIIAIPVIFISAQSFLTGSEYRTEFIISSFALTLTMLTSYAYAAAGAGFKAYEKLSIESLLLTIQSILNMVVYIYGAKHSWPLSRFFLAMFPVNLFITVVSYAVLARWVVKPELHANFKEARAMFVESLGLGYATLLRTLQDRIHVFFIGRLAGSYLITQFSSPNQLLINLKFIPLSIRPALFPTIARKATEESDMFQVYSLALMKTLYLIALPIIIMLTIARHEILPLVTTTDASFKTKYLLGIYVYPYVAWAVALSFPSQVLRSLFVAIRKPQYEFHTVLAGLLVLVAIDIIFIPKISIIACGIAAISCELVILIYGLILLHREGRGLRILDLFLLPTLCGIITNLSAEYLYGIHWALGIAGTLVIFPVLVLVTRVVSPVELKILREIISPGSQAGNST